MASLDSENQSLNTQAGFEPTIFGLWGWRDDHYVDHATLSCNSSCEGIRTHGLTISGQHNPAKPAVPVFDIWSSYERPMFDVYSESCDLES